MTMGLVRLNNLSLHFTFSAMALEGPFERLSPIPSIGVCWRSCCGRVTARAGQRPRPQRLLEPTAPKRRTRPRASFRARRAGPPRLALFTPMAPRPVVPNPPHPALWSAASPRLQWWLCLHECDLGQPFRQSSRRPHHLNSTQEIDRGATH
jgi:hypothetical protein